MKEQRFDKNVYMEFFYWLYQSLASSLCFWCVNILYIAAAFLLSIDGRNVFSLIFSLLFIGPGCIVMIGMTEELTKEKSFSSVRLFIKTFRRFWLKGFFYWLFAWIVSVIASSTNSVLLYVKKMVCEFTRFFTIDKFVSLLFRKAPMVYSTRSFYRIWFDLLQQS